ncbi:MAG: winged helix-turn-helix transcriptional regulator [Candidatus Aminicenantes bacterium]|nr:winged helix-turn-helix transcriptional regulator [Candidatus Aminicenantes bacterium]
MTAKDNQNKKAQILKALGHPIRLNIVEVLLEGERCVNDIKDLFGATQPNISQHLNILKFSGILDYRQDKNLRCYFLKNPEKIKQLVHAVRQFVNDEAATEALSLIGEY